MTPKPHELDTPIDYTLGDPTLLAARAGARALTDQFPALEDPVGVASLVVLAVTASGFQIRKVTA